MMISLSPAQMMVVLKGVALYGSDSLVGSVLESSHHHLVTQDFSPKSFEAVASALKSGSAWQMRGSLLYLGQMPNAVRRLSRGDSQLAQLVGIDASDIRLMTSVLGSFCPGMVGSCPPISVDISSGKRIRTAQFAHQRILVRE